MTNPPASNPEELDLTVVIRVRDDEERVGHVIKRVVEHLRSLKRVFEVLVADEGSGDNTLAIAALLRPSIPELEVLHAPPQHGFRVACERARGRAILLYDARSKAPLAPLNFAIERILAGTDVVAVGGKYIVLHRQRAGKVFDALVERRSQRLLEQRLLRRARALGLRDLVTHPAKGHIPGRVLQRLRRTLLKSLDLSRSPSV